MTFPFKSWQKKNQPRSTLTTEYLLLVFIFNTIFVLFRYTIVFVSKVPRIPPPVLSILTVELLAPLDPPVGLEIDC